MIERGFVAELESRMSEKHPLIQVVVGPRQVGKTTGIKQLVEKLSTETLYCSCDDLLSPARDWIIENWKRAKLKGKGTVLIIDEIQKVPAWEETIKRLWDQNEHFIKLILLIQPSEKKMQS